MKYLIRYYKVVPFPLFCDLFWQPPPVYVSILSSVWYQGKIYHKFSVEIQHQPSLPRTWQNSVIQINIKYQPSLHYSWKESESYTTDQIQQKRHKFLRIVSVECRNVFEEVDVICFYNLTVEGSKVETYNCSKVLYLILL